MNITVIGAGAIGGHIAARLAAAGESVSVVARGEHLKAIRARGLKLKEGGEEIVARVEATDCIAEVPLPDLVVLGVKAHQLAPIAADVASILTPETMVLTTQNGVPWWYFFKHGGPYEGHRLESVDPGGVIAGHLPVDAIIAGISYQAAEIESPGVIRHVEGHRLPLAEIDGSKSARVAALAELFSRAGFKSPVLSDVRTEIWTKLWGNLTFNPISALARATLEDICRFPPTRALAAAMMGEAQTVGEAFGIRFRLPIDKRIAGAEAIGPHKTSMLQDIEHGRAIEIDALLGSVIELARLAKVATPHLDAVYAATKLLGETVASGSGGGGGKSAMSARRTLRDLIASGKDEAVAIAGHDAPPLTYAALRALVDGAVAKLNELGVGRGDRIAIVLPNGPEMAAAFLSVAAAATAAPLNPAYRQDEFEFYLGDLNAKALIVEAGSESPALDAAQKLGVGLISLMPEPHAGAGAFRLFGDAEHAAARPGPAEAHDVALILHTSGTTSRPKIVPLTGANIGASADNIASSLELSERDRALNVMPLFHIHGLIAGLAAPLSRGGAVFCTPGFNALKFFAEMEAANPTWYTAVPTMHQAILTRAGRNSDIIARHPLRFVRSSSASLPPKVIGELEAAFHAPVIEAYGMTEAAHQMACNPLNGVRKPGSVGLAAGPEIAVMDEAGGLLGRGEIGEVVIRGDNVTLGYDNHPKANAEAFVNGWFRTGDQGVIDAEGYLTLTGRLKEIIIRGGEKISPREVDEALMDHPAVLQAVTFAIPHPMLGEDVAAAVVLREGASATEQDLHGFVGQRLAAFKTPRKIVLLAEIPKGATGKLQRIGLAQKLGLG